MDFSLSILQSHHRYNAWADARLLDACRALSEEQLVRDFGTSDRSVAGTLAHIFAADRAWLRRVLGSAPGPFLSEEEVSLAFLSTAWPPILAEWNALAERWTESDCAAVVRYRNLAGTPYETPLWQISLHLVNHATHHRGQIAGFLRAMQQTPPPLDLIAYYREQAVQNQ